MVARGPTIALVVVLVLAALLLLEGADGGWGGWSSWSSCTTSSDKRSCSQRRTRRCYKDGNTYCSGSRSWSRSCTSSPCLVDGGWTSWSGWREDCEVGRMVPCRTRTRTCTNPKPINGKGCSGSSKSAEGKLCVFNKHEDTLFRDTTPNVSPDPLHAASAADCQALCEGDPGCWHLSAADTGRNYHDCFRFPDNTGVDPELPHLVEGADGFVSISCRVRYCEHCKCDGYQMC